MSKRFLLLFLVSQATAASPFLVCDPQCYDTTALCPTGYEFSQDNGNTWAALDTEIAGNSIRIYHDMQPFNPGSHNWLVRAQNQWGVSDSLPFDFAAGNPAAASGLRLVAN